MAAVDGPVDKILDALRERAKELNCLYSVHEVLNRPNQSVDDACRALLEVLPRGWQYPAECWARITLEGAIYQPPDASPTPWVQRAPVVVQGETVGAVEVFYTRAMPRADEGPFLKEERRLIDTIAEWLAHFLMERRLQARLRNWAAVREALQPEARREWWVIIDFLRKTDYHLLTRLGRRMVNYLCWNGVEEAQRLLQRSASDWRDADAVAFEDNRPVERKSLEDLLRVTDDAFQIAATHLSEPEIVGCIEQWIKDDKASFLLEAVENQGTSVVEIADALERYHQLGLQERELSRPIQVGLRVSLTRRLLTDSLSFINTARNFLEVEDFHEVLRHVIAPSASHGKLGGKSAGLLLAAQIVRKSREYADTLGDIKVPRTWYIPSDGLLHFVAYNHLEDVYNRKYLEVDQIRREYPHIVQVFKHSPFPPELLTGLAAALDDLHDRPLIVRSSSLLEDRVGSAFSGKYKSLFLANRGSKAERLAALTDAIAEVYASVFSPDPIEYRAARGLLDLHEEMGIMIQEVVGTRVGRYFLPAWAGVAFSHNEFRWSARIRREDGLVRLVPGLGTRAVDRVPDDYPVLIAPGQPNLRVNVTPDEVERYAPRKVDLINLETRRFETVDFTALVREYGREVPALAQIASCTGPDGMLRPLGFDFDPARDRVVVTFEGLVAETPFVPRMRALLRVLREQMGGPVDIEFASDGRDFYLLQCRPQSFAEDAAPAPIPRDLPPERVLFAARRYVSNGRVPEITHVVYVDPERYAELATLAELRDVGRAVGRLNKLLPKRRFILMGPGRWGSRGDIRLGVSVTYADISHTAMLIEIAARRGQYVPDLSFGTHFFQDLVESAIRYLPLFPDDDSRLNVAFLRGAPNLLADLLPEYRHLEAVLRVVDLPRATGGLVLRVLMNADLDEAVGVLAAPAADLTVDARRAEEPVAEDHWRWRLRMAERIAAEADPVRFGIRGMYVFGSTKNATAGPRSDIDLIVHVDGAAEKRRALELWLEGWSRCLAELNYLRTGYRSEGLLDVHFVTDADLAARTSYAAKIGAVTDAARPLPVGTGQAPSAGAPHWS
jgi:pyruvate,water dikinase